MTTPAALRRTIFPKSLRTPQPQKKAYLKLTSIQWDVLMMVSKGDGETDDGKIIPIDLDQIVERRAIPGTKQSTQFVIRNLIEKGLIAKAGVELRRDRQRRLFLTTELGERMANPNESNVGFVDTSYEFDVL